MNRSFGTLKYDNDFIHVMPKKGKRWTKFVAYLKRFWPLYLMMLPMIVYLFIFSYIPMAGLTLGFKDWNPRLGLWGSPWSINENGKLDLFKNFRELFKDVLFWDSFKVTMKISAVRLLVGFPIPIIITILLNEMRLKKFSKGFQIVSYLPHFMSWVIIYGILISLVSTGSDLQRLIAQITGQELSVLSKPKPFFWIVILSQIWKEAGWSTIIYFAALAGINPELYEAADVDGATRFEKMIHITLPGLVPAISINLILQASNFVYGGFDQIFALTGNGVNTDVLRYVNITEVYLYQAGITQGNVALGTVIGMFNSVISFVLILIANRVIKKIGGDGLW